MILFIALSLLLGTIQAAEYAKDQLNAAYTARSWNDSESLRCVGYPVKVGFYEDDIQTVYHNKVSLFSPGFYKPINDINGAQSVVETFLTLPEKTRIGWLPGDFFIFDPKSSGHTEKTFAKSVSFGQNEDAFALIYCLNKLYDAGINEQSGIALHAQCYGFQRALNTLYYLSNNEQSESTENFFLTAGFMESTIDRIRREKLLDMIHSFTLQTPLKKASDGPVAIGHDKFIGKMQKGLPIVGIGMHLGLAFLDKQEKTYINLAGIGVFSLPIIFAAINRYFKLDHYVIKNHFMPHVYSYNNNALCEDEITSRLQYLIKENPHWSLFMTTAKDDRVVGNWGVAEFFENFPVAPDRKYLVPSPQFGHCKVTQQQIIAKNAFLRRYGSSYYKFPDEELNEGEATLDFAQEGQSKNIKEYIEYMESDDNEF